ncbi:MAG: tail fiber domain-containing protein [Chitinophagales bacterium]
MLLGAVNGNGIAGGTYMHVGINTNTPGNPLGDNVPAQLHIFNCTDVADPNVTAGSATIHARIRFNNLPINANSNWFVTADATTGKLYRRQVNFAPVLCQTTNFVPKALNANGDMTCSQIYDNGTSVGIGFANGVAQTRDYSYSSYAGFTLGIPIMIPSSGFFKLDVNGALRTQGYFTDSDKRFKKDIKPVTSALDKIKKLNGVTYNWRKEEFKDKNFDGSNQIGFIAQEVEKVIPQAVVKDGEGYYAMNYTMLIPVLTEAMKEQQKMIEQQQKEIDELKALVKGTTPKSVLDNPSKSIQLFQNVPNPFSKETDIKFYLPETVKQASLTIYDMQGKQLRKIDINDRNESSVKINAKELPAGMYMYSLIADGKEMDTKRMILTDY